MTKPGQPEGAGYGEFRRGWPIVLSSMLGVGLGLSPLPFYTIGLLAPQLAAAFGWGMGQIFFGITISSLVVVAAGPLAGFAASRFGVRRTALASTLLFGLAFMAFGLSNGSLPLYYLTWAAVAVLGAGTLPITWTRGVNSWFDERKGFALGLALMGTGLFGIVSKPLTAWLIAGFGWRGAYACLGLLPIVIAFPVAFAFFRHTDGDPRQSLEHRRAVEGLTFREVVTGWRFWVMAGVFLPISFALAGPVPNMENILRVGGIAKTDIIALTPFIGLSAILGRLIGGWMIDRFWAPAVALVILCLPGASCWILASGSLSFSAAWLSIMLIGFALGVEYDLMAFLVARYFGMRSYTAIYALLYGFFALGAGFGPAIFGWSFDRNGSYAQILTISFFVLIASAIALLTLGRYRAPAHAAAAQPASMPNVTAEHRPMAGR